MSTPQKEALGTTCSLRRRGQLSKMHAGRAPPGKESS